MTVFGKMGKNGGLHWSPQTGEVAIKMLIFLLFFTKKQKIEPKMVIFSCFWPF
jgi:hypothetical protein